MTRVRLVLLVQLLVTLVILVAVPATPLQALLLLGWWYVTFRPLRPVEGICFEWHCRTSVRCAVRTLSAGTHPCFAKWLSRGRLPGSPANWAWNGTFLGR